MAVDLTPTPERPRALGEPRPAKQGYQPSEQERAWIQRIRDRVGPTTRDPGRWAMDHEAFENILFYCGQQWTQRSRATGRIERWSAPDWFPTPVTNGIAPRTNMLVAGLLRIDPRARVRPNTNDAADREGARVGETVIVHLDEKTGERQLRQHAAAWLVLTGTTIAEDFWNPRKGRMLEIPRMRIVDHPAMEPVAQCPSCQAHAPAEQIGQPCPECGQGTLAPSERPRLFPDGSPAVESVSEPEVDPLTGEPIVDRVPEGEVESRIRGQFNFFWDSKAHDLDTARWCGEATVVDLDWIDENYPDLGPYVGAESGLDQQGGVFEAALLGITGASDQSGGLNTNGLGTNPSAVVVRKYQEKPSVTYPNGRFCVEAGGVLLYAGDLPLRDGDGNVVPEFTYTMVRYDLVPGRFLGRTVVEDMKALQRRINGIDCQVILNRKTLINPWIMAPKGSGLEPGQVAMRPGAVVVYNAIGVGQTPQVVPGTPLPTQVMEERSQCWQAMDLLANDAQATAPQVPVGARSGVALHFLREQIEEQGAPRRQRWGDWITARARKRLLLVQQHYRESRVVKLMGDGTEWQVKNFSGLDLRGNTDVTIDPNSLAPRSTSIKNQMIFDALEAQMIQVADPRDRQKLIEELNLPAFETPIGPDRRRALKENSLLETGQPIPTTEHDDDALHGAEHKARMQDPSFDNLPPEAQRAFEQHLQLHEQRAAAKEEEAKEKLYEDTERQLALEAQAKGVQVNMKRAAKRALQMTEDETLGTGSPAPQAASGSAQ